MQKYIVSVSKKNNSVWKIYFYDENFEIHSQKEFLYCTKKIMKNVILADENRRRMIHNQQNKKL